MVRGQGNNAVNRNLLTAMELFNALELFGVSYIKAWQEGARQWREYQPRGQAGFYVIRDAWQEFEPVGLPGGDSGGSPYRINKLGILYAKYGKIDDAAEQFQKAIDEREYVPALINLGNVYYLQENWQKALIFYQRAAAEDPDNDQAILCTAKVYHEMENYQLAQKNYDELKKINPDLAGEFAYIDMGISDGTRAADVIRQRETILWSDTDE